MRLSYEVRLGYFIVGLEVVRFMLRSGYSIRLEMVIY